MKILCISPSKIKKKLGTLNLLEMDKSVKYQYHISER